jgi:hypothetical protein
MLDNIWSFLHSLFKLNPFPQKEELIYTANSEVIVNQVNQIIELLEDPSFPQIVMLNGAWGSGKTHFIHHHLKDKIKEQFNQKIYFFSLYGISSMDDFRDKIISMSLTDKEETSVLAKYISKAIDGAANNLGERGVGAMLSGVAGAYKYKLYGELDDCVLILDDLERVVEDKLIQNILGECLNLAESKNIKIVVAANEDKLNCKNDIEKVFSDKYHFSYTHEEVTSIIKKEYENIDHQLANELLQNITAINSKNIRVLKRAISKFTRIQKEVSQIENVVLDQALSNILGYIIRICSAKFEHAYSKEMIIDSIITRVIRQTDKDEGKEKNNDYKKLDEIFDDSFYGVNDKLISYCCDGLYEFTNLKLELNLPIKQSLLDSMKSSWVQNQLSDEEFKKGVLLLESFISDETEVDIYEWFSICDTYVYMLDKKVINSKVYTQTSLLSLCDSVEIERFKTPTADDEFSHRHAATFFNTEVSKKFRLKKEELETINKGIKYSQFFHDFQSSWTKVKDDAHQNLMHEPIFQDISDIDIEIAFRNWSNDELFHFVRFMNQRYAFNNIKQFFEPEIKALKSFSALVDCLIKEFEIGLKVASLIELYDILNDAYSRMEKQ